MKVIVVGCGKIGTALVAGLAEEGHDVVAVDTDPQVIEEITNIYDVMGVCGSGTDYDTLLEADVQNTDLMVAVTALDELNMLSCYIGGKMGAAHTIARIRRPEYNIGILPQHLGLSMSINPEQLAAKKIYNILQLPFAVKTEMFSQKSFEIVEMILKEDSKLVGVHLKEIRSKFKQNFLVCAVQRGETVCIPDGDFILCQGDKIGLVAAPSEINKLMRALGVLGKQGRNVMILGGSRVAYYLAKMLSSWSFSVKIIDQDRNVCTELSKVLPPKTVIIHGDGARQELLKEEGIEMMDAFVSLTGMDEENILISIFAAVSKVPKVIAKVNRPELISMAQKLGLDCIISPRKIVSDVVLRYARALENSKGSNVETLYKIMDGKAEVLEFNVSSDFEGKNIPLKDLTLKENILIGGIYHGKKVIIPSGFDQIMAGDKVIVISSGWHLNDLSDILQTKGVKYE